MYNPASMNTTSPFDLVIFDCDGVLVDSEPLANQVYVQMLGEFGYQVGSDQTLREMYGLTLFRRLEISSERLNWTPPTDFRSIFNERLSALSETELKPVPGIHSLLDSLSTPICVASNGFREEIDLRLKACQLTDYFGDAIFSGMEVPHPKPAPDVYLAAAKTFDASPARCIVIEDSIPGVTAAVRAGMKVFGHSAFMNEKALREAGAIPFADMMELQNILSSSKFRQ